MPVLVSFSIILFIEPQINNINYKYKQNMSYSEILNATTQRIKTQFNRHATLAIGPSSILANQTQAVILLPAFSCIATDLVNLSFRNASAANADASPLRSAVITVNPANGVPTLTVTVAAQAAGTAIEFNYVIYRAAN
jgi:type IV pilus biogenesis protein CpaD/CtpE